MDDRFLNKMKPLYRSIQLLDGPLAAHTSKRTLVVRRRPPSDQDRNGRPNMFRTRASIAIGPTLSPTCASYIAANIGHVPGLDDPGQDQTSGAVAPTTG